jgi:hypothetical protein
LLANPSSDILVGYSDSDFAGDLDTMRSTTGYTYLFNGTSIAWRSARQTCVTTSTAAAEFLALSEATKEALVLNELIIELQPPELQLQHMEQPSMLIYGDNEAALTNATDTLAVRRKFKHLAAHRAFVQEQVAGGQVQFTHVASKANLADVFTKGLPGPVMEEMRHQLLGTSSISI